MRNGNHSVRERERLYFSKIKSSIQIPNLSEVQRMSYQRFLQMDLLPSEREDTGLQSVFSSVFPIQDFRGLSQLDFVDYSIGNWECKCGNLKGLHHLRATCRQCGASVVTNPYQTGDVICTKCGTFNKNTPTFCNKCGDPVGMQLKYDVVECGARFRRSAQGDHPPHRLTGPDTGARISDIGTGSLLRRRPLMTDNGHSSSTAPSAYRQPIAPFPGVFYETITRGLFVPGKIIPYRGSWVEFEYDTKASVRTHRPQTQIPGFDLPARWA
jgi:DNA-directed RNA polymerase subunit beta